MPPHNRDLRNPQEHGIMLDNQEAVVVSSRMGMSVV
jgi:hypothetical protein